MRLSVNGMFTDRVKRVMQLARDESVRLGNDYVGTEHLLLGLLREGDGGAINVFRSMGIDIEELGRQVEHAVTSSGALMTIGQMIPFTPRAKRVLEVAAQEARQLKSRYIGTEHLLMALLKDDDSAASNALSHMNIEYDKVKEEVDALHEGTGDGESDKASSKSSSAGGRATAGKDKKSKTPFLDHFGRDLTRQAAEGGIDPIVGRDEEIERIIQILSRRKKNNPVLIGEPGVGKTAIVEGLAQRIVMKQTPQILENKKVITLDMATMVAGTKYRGQFEERLKALMAELEKNKDIIIFIDELHTIVGAGGSEGSLDASNMFKPALARGELQCIGATTIDEYRKYIEKDGALERRFQSILVEQPSIPEAIQIMKGIRPKYEKHHRITYTDAALEKSVVLSERYIADRALPDKAIDVIDEAGARVRLASMVVPQEINDLEDELKQVTEDKEQAVKEQDFEKAAQMRDRQDAIKEQMEEVREAWRVDNQEQKLVVDEDSIREVIAKMTGVPVTRVSDTMNAKVLGLEDELKKRVIGQEAAIASVAKAVRRSSAGIHSPDRPLGSFMFLGPTGVGKTELVKALTSSLFGKDDAMIRIDMSEFMEKFTVSRLIGAPPGYVGYEDQGGQLTEKVRQKPYSVVLFDEIEKAHPDVFNILLQILDEGAVTDNHGRKVSFKNTIIIMTSNVGAKHLRKGTAIGFSKGGADAEQARIEAAISDEIKKAFNPEFINRIDELITFRALSEESLIDIIDILLSGLEQRMHERNIKLEISLEAKQKIVKEGTDVLMGARPLKRALQRLVEDALAENFLEGRFSDGSIIEIGLENDELTFNPKDSLQSEEV